ncbi:putative sugar phosphate/phosphate translocator [Citrus sinensis]|uniref:Sugar phosphate/phosphate translocator n=1 Tax=Citrus sinensis TaxID=2711 RepID=A0ACB8NN63_CITSI|nr:putative sugar phosphate/phosphate translocator [Citrus sinensis]KAH9799138.1 putative sugar phosphate/phosphate translocator [Citrus sinensis]
MGKGGSLSDGVIKKILLSYTYVAIWIFLSFTVIVYNKYILDKKMYNWPFPISLTMIHMSFCATLAFLLIKVFKFVEPVTMSRDLYFSSVVPIGALYSLSLWLSNSAYIYLSVSFIQMLKALMPVAVYSIGVMFKKESFKSDTMCNMVSISVGVAIAAYGEAKFDSWGVVLQLGAVAFEATRLVMIQILLTSKGITLNPITSLYYVAPCCLVFLLVPWIFVELPILRETSSFHFDFVIFGTNSLCAFALNLAVFLLVGKTSALTMNVAGVVKDWLLIAFSWSVIKDTVTPINLFGYGLAFLGVAYYNHSKLQALKAKEAQKKAQQADEESGKLLEERDGEGELLAKKPNYNDLSVVLSPSYSGPGCFYVGGLFIQPHCHPQNAFDVVRTLGDDADALKRDMGPQQSNYTDLILVVEFFCNCLYVERNNEGLQCSR